MQSHIEPTKQIDETLEHSSQMIYNPVPCSEEKFVDSEIQSLVQERVASEHIQNPQKMEKCTSDNTEKNEEGCESGDKTLPLYFSSFELLKQNGVSNHKMSNHEVESNESIGLTGENPLPLCFSSFEWLRENYEISERIGTSDYIHSITISHERVVISKEN
jgi:hypothetical protein